jgi:hypothetical protein
MSAITRTRPHPTLSITRRKRWTENTPEYLLDSALRLGWSEPIIIFGVSSIRTTDGIYVCRSDAIDGE